MTNGATPTDESESGDLSMPQRFEALGASSAVPFDGAASLIRLARK